MHEIIFLCIPLAIVLELFYDPNIGRMKSEGLFPSIKIFGFTLLPSEFFTILFIISGIIYYIYKNGFTRRIHFAPKDFLFLPEAATVLLIISCVEGLLFKNTGFLKEFRIMLIPPVFYLVYVNSSLRPRCEKYFLRILITGLCGLFLVYAFDALGFGIFDALRALQVTDHHKLLHVLTLLVLLFLFFSSRALFSGSRFRWWIVPLSVAMFMVVNVSYKICLFSLIIGGLFLLCLAIVRKRLSLRKAVLTVACIFLGISFLFSVLPSSIKENKVSLIAWRYFKVDGVHTLKGLFDNLSSGHHGDMSGYKSEIWVLYLQKALKGYGFAPHGFGHRPYIKFGGCHEAFGKGVHNYLVYFSYQGGLIAAFLLLLLMARFIVLGYKLLSHATSREYGGAELYVVIALFCFSVSLLISNMAGGTWRSYSVSIPFWFSVGFLINRWELLRAGSA